MKPLFILLYRDGEPHAAVNANDIKWIRIAAESAQIVTSTTCSVAPFTVHMGTRLTSELRERYNVVYLSSRGLTRDNLGRPNDILRISSDDSVTYVFPKGLKTVEIANGAVDVTLFDQGGTISPHGHRVQVTGQVDLRVFDGLLAAHIEA
jgi:hypothetical protein